MPVRLPWILSLGLIVAFAVPKLEAQTAAALSQTAAAGSTGQSAETAPAPWIVGLASFTAKASDAKLAPLRTILPLLMAADLGDLPPHITSVENRAAAAEYAALQKYFGAGSALYARLDDRALRFLDPSPSQAQRTAEIMTADTNVRKARDTLAAALAASDAWQPAKEPVQSALWDGNRQGRLLDPTAGIPAAIATTEKVDLIVFGSLHDRSGYAEAVIKGYDAQLGRDVFSWKGYCSVEDPAPLARAFARKIEEWTAGKPFSRLLIVPAPESARIAVDGTYLPIGQRVIYRFQTGTFSLRVEAPGFVPVKSQIELGLGEWKQVSVRLDPKKTGSVIVSASPASALISLDSLPVGPGPRKVELDGTRIVATATAPGYESGFTVLPRSGDTEAHIDLRPSDGLGPGGRIEKAKDSFYGSLGWFVLSVPVTALTAGLASGYAEAASRTGDPQFVNQAQGSQIALGVAAGASILLAINAVIHLVSYIESAH